MYHRIGKASFDPWGLAVEEENFDAQLRWLARHRDVMPLTEFARRHRERRLGRDALAITFDDGYSSVLSKAVPLLEEHGLTATLFLPVKQIEQGREFWWDELARIILGFAGDCLRLGTVTIPVSAASQRDEIWAPDAAPSTPRQQLFHLIWEQLRLKPPGALEAAMKTIRSQAHADKPPPDPPLSAEQLQAKRSPLVEFGSHAMTHSSLPALSEKDRMREITQSREACKALTGKLPATFAYPYGDSNVAVGRLVQNAGYECAVTTDPSFVKPQMDSFQLPRLGVGNWPAARLRQRLRGS